jgi:hypothetical protein
METGAPDTGHRCSMAGEEEGRPIPLAMRSGGKYSFRSRFLIYE